MPWYRSFFTFRKILQNIGYCLNRGFSIRLVLLCDIHNIANLPLTTEFPHPSGIVLGDVILGEHCVICQNVTVGLRRHKMFEGNPRLSDNVFVGPNAVILGKIKIGVGAKIGAGSVVLKDVPAYTLVTGIWK